MRNKDIELLKEKALTGKSEIRTFDKNIKLAIESRSADDGSTTLPVIVGYGAVFESPSTGLPWVEILSRNCMDNTDFSQCFGLFNHEENIILGSVRSGSVILNVDDNGLHYQITPPDNDYVRAMYVDPIKRGDVIQSSFRFALDYSDPANPPDEWYYDEENDQVVRKINRIYSVTDVSPVLFPAYDSAESSIRSAMSFNEKRKKEVEEKRSYQDSIAIVNLF